MGLQEPQPLIDGTGNFRIKIGRVGIAQAVGLANGVPDVLGIGGESLGQSRDVLCPIHGI